MKLGVLTNLFGSLPLEEALVKFEKLGIEAVEIGCGGYPGRDHADPAILLNDEEKLGLQVLLHWQPVRTVKV